MTEALSNSMDSDLPRPRPEAMAPRILVVEDDDEMRDLVEEMLREEGYRTFAAPDSLSALMLLLADGADVVVTDWKMPPIDGLDLLESVRRCAPGLPVIFVTAYADEGLRARALRGGARSFLAKPFQRADLLAHVRGALSRAWMGRAGRRPGRTGDDGPVGE